MLPVRVVDILILSSFDHTKTEEACSRRQHSHPLFIRPQENGRGLFASSTFSPSLHSTTGKRMMPIRVVNILTLSSFDHRKTDDAYSRRRHSHPLFIRPQKNGRGLLASSTFSSSLHSTTGKRMMPVRVVNILILSSFDHRKTDEGLMDSLRVIIRLSHSSWGQRPHTPGKSHEDE